MSGPRPRSASAAAVDEHTEWMTLRGLSPVYVMHRRRLLTRLSGALGVPLLDATAADLTRWRAGLTVAPVTIGHLVSHTRMFYAWCVTRRLIRASPAAGLPAPKIRKGLPRPIAEDRLMLALSTAPPRIRPWLVLAAWAGLRAQEIARLRREDIVLAPAPLLIVSAFAAKGGRERVVPLSPFVVAELLAAGLPARGWVFVRHDGKSGANAAWVISQLSNEHLHSCGVPDTLHSLRHRFASQAYQASRDIRAVQSLLGHANLADTAIYAAFAPSAASAAVAGVPVPEPEHSAGTFSPPGGKDVPSQCSIADDGPPVPRPEDYPEHPGWTAPVVPLRGQR